MMDEVTARASGSRKENGVGVKNREPSETMKADKDDVEAGRMTNEVTRGREGKDEAGVDNNADTQEAQIDAVGAFNEIRHVKDVKEGEGKSVTIGFDGGDIDSANAANGAVNTGD